LGNLNPIAAGSGKFRFALK